MAKIQINDVVSKEKRSIRNIPIPSQERRSKSSSFGQETTPIPVQLNRQPPPTRKESEREEYFGEGSEKPKRARSKYFVKILAFAFVIGFILFMMTLFSSANVNLSLKTAEVPVNIELNAEEIASLSSLRSETIEATKADTEPVKAGGEETVERKASGKIKIYNDFSSEPQRLITRTRFESKEGLIYRIPESVVVPGKTASGSGVVEVLVYADEPGSKYNTGENRFTIPGFKNDAERFQKFYAQTSTNIDGGFVGKVKKVEESDKAAAYSSIDQRLQNTLQKDLETQVPDSLVLLRGASTYSSIELAQEDSGSGTTLKKQGTLSAIIFNKEDLSKKIHSSAIASSQDWQNIAGKVVNFENLSVTLEGTAKNPTKITITGKALVTADISEEEIKSSLLGQDRDSISEIMANFPGILSARTTIRPMWKNSFPENSQKIYIEYGE